MPGRSDGGQTTSRSFNWLEMLDKEAAKLTRATSWLEPYGPFMLARYPNLRPKPINGDVHSQIMCDSGEQTAGRLFAEWESRIMVNTESSVCLEKLDAGRRRQLAALLLETVVDLEMRTATDRSSHWAWHVCKEAARRLRVLNRKLQKARQAIQEVMVYAEDPGKRNALDAPRHSARQMLGHPYRIAAARALRALDERSLPAARQHVELASELLASQEPDPEVFGMVRLYWFFRHECGLSGHESEVRTARLRNAFWPEYGVRKVGYRAKYVTGQSQGCEAVHVAVNRFKPQ
jgi:hypothetical protein